MSRSAILHAEAYFSAEPPPPFQDARFPSAHEEQGRPGSARATTCQGAEARVGEAWLPRVVARIEVSHVPAAGGVSGRLWRSARLRKHCDFENVYRNGQRIFSTHMTFFFLNQDPGLPSRQRKSEFADAPASVRVGFTVPRILGKAVERNRIRRRLREAVRLNLSAAGAAVDVVIHPKKSVLTADSAQLRLEVARAFQKVKSQVGGGELRAPGSEVR